MSLSESAQDSAIALRRYDGGLGEKNSSRTRSLMVLVAANLLSLGCLVWSLRGAHLGELKEDLATMDWWWVGLAVVAGLTVYLLQGIRWSLLLRPVVPVTVRQATRAIYVGLFSNEVLPFHVGELLRCFVLARDTKLPFSVSLSSALIERIFDGIWLCLFLFLTLKFIPIPRHMHYLVDTGYWLGVMVLSLAVVIGLAMFHKQQTHAALSDPPGVKSRWRKQLRILIEDLGLIGHSRYLYLAFLQSLPYLLLQVIPIYAAFRGYGFDLSLGTAFGLMVILRLGSVVPQAPANLGLFQFLTTESLVRIFNVVPAEAARFSLVLWGIVTLPLLVSGAIALDITGVHLGDLHRDAHGHAKELARSRI